MLNVVRSSIVSAVVLLPAAVFACGMTKGLQGVLPIPQCDPESKKESCILGHEAVYAAIQALDMPGVFTIGLQTSPWRMYDATDRIITVREMADTLKKKLEKKHRRVYLVGSWTAARPDGDPSTLAKRLSSALDGFPVDGSDGFLWLSPKGRMRTTHQAFSLWKNRVYRVSRGADVMVAMVPGALARADDGFAEDGNADGVVHAGVGQDVFMLCPEQALAAFERAGTMGSAIGAYNAGIIHAEAGRQAAAARWLKKAEGLGDEKAAQQLALLRTRPAAKADNQAGMRDE